MHRMGANELGGGGARKFRSLKTKGCTRFTTCVRQTTTFRCGSFFSPNRFFGSIILHVEGHKKK